MPNPMPMVVSSLQRANWTTLLAVADRNPKIKIKNYADIITTLLPYLSPTNPPIKVPIITPKKILELKILFSIYILLLLVMFT